MSIKIYNGYISNLNLVKTAQKFDKIKKKFRELIEKEFEKTFVKDLIEELDRKYHDQKEIKVSDYTDELWKRKVKDVKETVCIGVRNPDYDLTMSCGLCELRTGLFRKRKTFILLNTESDKVTEEFEKLGFISDYHYQDQTDKPEGISKREWNKRKRNWLKIDKKNISFIVYEFRDWYLPWLLLETIKELKPTDEQRARVLLKESFTEAEIKKEQEKTKQEFRASMYFHACDKYAEFIKTEEFKKQLEDKIKALLILHFKD